MLRLLLLALSASLRQHLAGCLALIAMLAVTRRSPVGPGEMVLVLLLAFSANVLLVLLEGLAWARRLSRDVREAQRLLERRARSSNLN